MVFWQCNFALGAIAAELAAKTGGKAADIRADLAAGLRPDVRAGARAHLGNRVRAGARVHLQSL